MFWKCSSTPAELIHSLWFTTTILHRLNASLFTLRGYALVTCCNQTNQHFFLYSKPFHDLWNTFCWISHMNSLPFHQDIVDIHEILNFTSLFFLTEYVERDSVFIEDVVNALILLMRWKIRTGVGESGVKMSGSPPTLIQSGKVTLTYSLLPTHVSRADMSVALNPGVKEQMTAEECHGICYIY